MPAYENYFYTWTPKKNMAEVCLWESYCGSSLIIWDTALIKKQMTNVVIKGHYKCFSLDSWLVKLTDNSHGCHAVFFVFNGADKLCLLAALLLGYTFRVLVMSYQLPWQCTRSTKVSSKFQFLQIIWTNSVTYHFYLFVVKFPKLFTFSDGKGKSYLVELNIFKENAF